MLGDSEVAQLQPVPREHHVGEFEVRVDNPSPVSGGQCFCNADRDREQFLQRERALAQTRLQGFAPRYSITNRRKRRDYVSAGAMLQESARLAPPRFGKCARRPPPTDGTAAARSRVAGAVTPERKHPRLDVRRGLELQLHLR